MTRFCITMAQAIDLVLKAFKANPGDVLVPKLPSVKIGTVAYAVSTGQVWDLVGLRPGEKLVEAMIGPDEPCYDAISHYVLSASGKPGFSYSSDNTDFLSHQAFRELLDEAAGT